MTILDQSETLGITAAICEVTTSTVELDSRCSRDSPQQNITPRPPSIAALAFKAMNYEPHVSECYLVVDFSSLLARLKGRTSSDSPRIWRRSLWPRMTQVMFESLSWSTEISPVKAPSGLS